MSKSSGARGAQLAADIGAGTALAEAAREIGKKEHRFIIAACIDGQVMGLSTVLDHDARVEFLTFDTPEGKEVLRHTAAHVMAHAVKRLYPDARLGIGPAIEDGFYYDIDAGGKLSDEDLPAIEKEMLKIIKEDIPLERLEMSCRLLEDGKILAPDISRVRAEYTAWDPDGLVDTVEFYVGDEFIGANPGKSLIEWTTPVPGIHTISLIATEVEEGLQRTVSARVLIPETNPGNQRPTVEFTTPADGSAAVVGSYIAASVEASDSESELDPSDACAEREDGERGIHWALWIRPLTEIRPFENSMHSRIDAPRAT